MTHTLQRSGSCCKARAKQGYELGDFFRAQVKDVDVRSGKVEIEQDALGGHYEGTVDRTL